MKPKTLTTMLPFFLAVIESRRKELEEHGFEIVIADINLERSECTYRIKDGRRVLSLRFVKNRLDTLVIFVCIEEKCYQTVGHATDFDFDRYFSFLVEKAKKEAEQNGAE